MHFLCLLVGKDVTCVFVEFTLQSVETGWKIRLPGTRKDFAQLFHSDQGVPELILCLNFLLLLGWKVELTTSLQASQLVSNYICVTPFDQSSVDTKTKTV